MNAKKEIFDQRIRRILFSPRYAESIYSVFIELWDGNRFRLTEHGPSYADVDKDFDDLRELNITELPHEYFIGQFIEELVHPDDEYAHLILENNWKIGIGNDFIYKSFYIGTYKWKLNDNFYNQPLYTEKPSNPYLLHQQIINYFLRNGFGTEMPILMYFSILHNSDRIFIMENLIENELENTQIYDKLSIAYAKNGDTEKGLKVLKKGLDKGYIDSSNYYNMKTKIQMLIKTNPTEYLTQKKYIKNNLSEASSHYEKSFLNQIDKIVDKHYSN
jgi:hypothetical protein